MEHSLATAAPFALRPTAEHCAHCGMLVQVRRWVMATKATPGRWEAETVPLTCVTGQKHRCQAEEYHESTV